MTRLRAFGQNNVGQLVTLIILIFVHRRKSTSDAASILTMLNFYSFYGSSKAKELRLFFIIELTLNLMHGNHYDRYNTLMQIRKNT